MAEIGPHGVKILSRDDIDDIHGRTNTPIEDIFDNTLEEFTDLTIEPKQETSIVPVETRGQPFSIAAQNLMISRMNPRNIRQRSQVYPAQHYRYNKIGNFLLPTVDPIILLGFVESEPHLRACVDVKADDASRSETLIIPKFQSKCRICGMEFDREIKVCTEDGCGGPTVGPDPLQRQFLKRVMEDPNPQFTWKDIRKFCEWFLEAIDDVWLEVKHKRNGDPQFWPSAPEVMRILDPKVKMFRCTRCGSRNDNPGYCLDHPEVKLERVRYVELQIPYGSVVHAHYSRYDMVHYNRYGTRYYGNPTTWSLRNHIRGMLESVMCNADAFEGRNVPNKVIGLEGMGDSEIERLKNEWDAAVNVNEHYIPLTNAKVSATDIFPSNKDMQWQQMYIKFRNTILAAMKTPLLKLGSSETGGAGQIVGWQLIGSYWDNVEDGMEQFDEAMNRHFKTYHDITDWFLKSQSSRPFDTEKIHNDERSDISSGIKSINEVRIDRGLDPVLLPNGEPDPAFDKPISPTLTPSIFQGEDDTEIGPSPSTPQRGCKKPEHKRVMPPRDAGAGERIPGVASVEERLKADLKRELRKLNKSLQGKRLSERQALNIVRSFLEDLDPDYEDIALQSVRDAYTKGVTDALNDEGISFSFSEADQVAVDFLATQPQGIIQSLKSFDNDITIKFEAVIRNAFTTPGEFDLDRMVSGMSEVVDAEVFKLERIARSEVTLIANTAKDRAYQIREAERGEEFLFDWVGPTDARNSEICPWIKSQVDKRGKGKGVTREELREIQQQGISQFGTGGVFLRPHVNCRHTIVREV